jgi:hypothetical protein
MRAGVASLPQSEGKSVRAARCPDGRKTAQRPPHQALPRSVVANVTRFLYLNRPLAASHRAPLAEAVISGHDDANHHHPRQPNISMRQAQPSPMDTRNGDELPGSSSTPLRDETKFPTTDSQSAYPCQSRLAQSGVQAQPRVRASSYHGSRASANGMIALQSLHGPPTVRCTI